MTRPLFHHGEELRQILGIDPWKIRELSRDVLSATLHLFSAQ